MPNLLPMRAPLVDRDDLPPEVRSAIDTLIAYAGGDAAAAKIMQTKMARHVVEKLGKRTDTPVGWRWTLGAPKSNASYQENRLPGDDHIEYWQKDGKRVRVSHPYGMDFDAVSALVDHCREHGLRFRISAGSWYYPGSTLAVLMEKDDRPSPQDVSSERKGAN